jgi:hypothetical protein
MNEFVHKREDRIHGVLSWFDRMLFHGYLPIMSGWSMAQFLQAHDTPWGPPWALQRTFEFPLSSGGSQFRPGRAQACCVCHRPEFDRALGRHGMGVEAGGR